MHTTEVPKLLLLNMCYFFLRKRANHLKELIRHLEHSERILARKSENQDLLILNQKQENRSVCISHYANITNIKKDDNLVKTISNWLLYRFN